MVCSSILLLVAALAASSPLTAAFQLTLTARKNSYPGALRSRLRLLGGVDIDDIERRALAASEAWDVDVTPFLDPSDASAIEERLANRADCACLRAGGYAGSSRARFVLTNPELGLDAESADADHCAVLRVSNADLRNSDPLPNVVAGIGVDFDDVGDIVVDGERTAYLVVAPGTAAKACARLLPKELAGTGVTVAPLELGEAVPEGGELQDMEIKRLDKREQKRRK